MFEHVGYKNYREYMEVVDRCLNDDGLSLLHTVGSNTTSIDADPWTNKYIFPNGSIPSLSQINDCVADIFTIEDFHNFGPDYDKTLVEWYNNFVESWPYIKDNYDQRFYRMWTYYLLSFAGAFRSRYLQLWQIVLSKNINGGYESIR